MGMSHLSLAQDETPTPYDIALEQILEAKLKFQPYQDRLIDTKFVCSFDQLNIPRPGTLEFTFHLENSHIPICNTKLSVVQIPTENKKGEDKND